MPLEGLQLGFPLWLRVTHYLNIFLLFLLVRSGIQILLDFPRYFFNEHCTPGSEWLKFTRKPVPTDRIWTSTDEALPINPIVALPGGRHALGVGRHWHLFTVLLWTANGLTYVALLFATGNWRRLVPTSWDVLPGAWRTFVGYLTLRVPSPAEFDPYDPLQQLAYAAVVFVLAPLTIATGLALSPAIAARFPWSPRIFRGRQTARSLHFLLLAAFLGFTAIHVTMVILVRPNESFGHMVFGRTQPHDVLAMGIAAAAVALLVVAHALLTRWSRRSPRAVQHTIGRAAQYVAHLLLYRLQSRQAFRRDQVSPYFWLNGRPPGSAEWLALVQSSFTGYQLTVGGLVENPLKLPLAELRAMPAETQVTEHSCIQGWTGIAEWTGVPLAEVLKRCRPLPQARYLVLRSFQSGDDGREYYETITLEEAASSQTLLAWAMNGEPLPVNHGAPLRLRLETRLGFKMVKWLRSIEAVESFEAIGDGQGGHREDALYYTFGAEI